MTNKAAASTTDVPSKQDKHSKSDTLTLPPRLLMTHNPLDEAPKQASQLEQNSASDMSEKKESCVGVTRPIDTDHYSSMAPQNQTAKVGTSKV